VQFEDFIANRFGSNYASDIETVVDG